MQSLLCLMLPDALAPATRSVAIVSDSERPRQPGQAKQPGLGVAGGRAPRRLGALTKSERDRHSGGRRRR